MAAEATLLTLNREKLVHGIRLVEPLLDKLLQTNQITAEECAVVRCGMTPHNQARALIELVGTKGQQQDAFSHFRGVLKEANPELEDELHRCAIHNNRIKHHCDDCVQLLCRQCSLDGHNGHRVSSIVAGACAIRREFTAFIRDNRKLLKRYHSADDAEDRQELLLDAERRKNKLKETINASIESEFEWFEHQLGSRDRATSPAASISSVATTESEMSSSEPEIEAGRSTKTESRKRLRAHPYSSVDQKYRGLQPRTCHPNSPNTSPPRSPVIFQTPVSPVPRFYSPAPSRPSSPTSIHSSSPANAHSPSRPDSPSAASKPESSSPSRPDFIPASKPESSSPSKPESASSSDVQS